VTTAEQRPQPTSTPTAEQRSRPRPQPASTPTAGLCTRGGAAPVAGPVTTLEQRPQLASTPTAGLHDEGPPCSRLASMPKIQWADDLRRHPLCRTREAIEKKEVALKRRKASVRVSRRFQRFGNRADSFRGQKLFSSLSSQFHAKISLLLMWHLI